MCYNITTCQSTKLLVRDASDSNVAELTHGHSLQQELLDFIVTVL